MFGSNRRLRALVYLLVLFPLWWLQRTHANPLSGHSAGGLAHGHHAKSAQPGGDGGHHSNDGGGGDGDDGGGHDGDDGGGGDGDDGDDGGGHDGDDDDGHDGDDDGDDDDGGHITDCNHNGIDDSIDIANGTSQDVNHDGIPDECQSFTRDYCNGTGAANGGVDCPCGNTVRSGTPTGCANSTGSGATLTASGSAFVSHDTLVLTVTNIPLDHTGVFYMGSVRIPGHTYGDGTRCIAAPLVRVSKVSHSTGRESIPVPGSPPLSVQLSITAGQTTGFQVFYRDGGGPCHTGFNASNAVLIFWGP